LNAKLDAHVATELAGQVTVEIKVTVP